MRPTLIPSRPLQHKLEEFVSRPAVSTPFHPRSKPYAAADRLFRSMRCPMATVTG